MEDSSKEKLHRHLDGETERRELSPSEAREIGAHEAIIREAGKLYRAVHAPDLAATVMSRVTASDVASRTAASQPVHRRLASWLWEPRPVQVRPAVAAFAAVVMVLLVFVSRTNDRAPTEVPPGPVPASTIFVQFRVDAPEGSDVQLAGSFTGWKPTYPLRETAPGIWSVVVPLEPGVHDYAFLINGQWITDPVAPVVDDGFGGANSRLLVVLPDASSRL